jgi:hypothetical protein
MGRLIAVHDKIDSGFLSLAGEGVAIRKMGAYAASLSPTLPPGGRGLKGRSYGNAHLHQKI